jgi:hypothetical protein
MICIQALSSTFISQLQTFIQVFIVGDNSVTTFSVVATTPQFGALAFDVLYGV